MQERLAREIARNRWRTSCEQEIVGEPLANRIESELYWIAQTGDSFQDEIVTGMPPGWQ
jgi:hypothetical protein